MHSLIILKWHKWNVGNHILYNLIEKCQYFAHNFTFHFSDTFFSITPYLNNPSFFYSISESCLKMPEIKVCPTARISGGYLWYYDQIEKQCLVTSDCILNENRFESEEACKDTCQPKMRRLKWSFAFEICTINDRREARIEFIAYLLCRQTLLRLCAQIQFRVD